jgi:uncharacterized protein (UPF0147 family)
MTQEVFDQVKEIIENIFEDQGVPKNVTSKLNVILDVIKNDDCDFYIKTDKIIQHLEEISEDSNIQAYVRTQLWNITSLLEGV